MKIFISLALLALSAQAYELDPNVDLDEFGFEERFGLDHTDDPEEFAKRSAALKESENGVKEANKNFLAGEGTWFENINEWSNLPEEDFVKQHCGMKQTPEENKYDPASEEYFRELSLDRATVPAEYNAVTKGLVSSVKDQGNCGSCVAFATVANLEVCYKKLLGVGGDYSEQQLVDCAYGHEGAEGCNGAGTSSYIDWYVKKKAKASGEHQYKYKGTKGTCPKTMPVYNQGATVTGQYMTWEGTETLMKQMIAKHGSVVAVLKAAGPFSRYKGGIFAGCPANSQPDHAILVVGYGTLNKVDYWLIKNSWGASWGEKGYIRMKRGVGMCGIGKEFGTVKCGKVSGTTDAPPTTTVKATTAAATTATATTTAKPSCADEIAECKEFAQWGMCNEADIANNWCKKTCKKC